MNYRYLGRTGLQVSELSLGSWVTFHNQVDTGLAADCMAAAYDAGCNFFDNAEVYAAGKSEELMGAAFRKLGWRRGSYLVSTKFFWGINDGINEKNTLNRKYLIEAMNGSLKRLGLEYVDLVYCHRPDPHTPIEETVWAMHNLIEWGKALYWGTSEWSAQEISEAIAIAERHHLHKPKFEQPQYNLFERYKMEKDYTRLFADYGYGTTTWSPLASGLLTGKYNKGIPADSRGALPGYEWLREHLTDPTKLAKVQALQELADSLACSLADLSLAWCLKNPRVSTVITGATKVAQVKANMKASACLSKLDSAAMERIDAIVGKP